ncbi:unnamed protein product [Ceutorhynchus assimilis]|uniref:Proteasome assembly chaperone 4 n=1 Tax=Ceutorhynchus assimilis TaxID=467358 RepID=A0A9N9MM43_9CUCU|nr:unnamed protein product [Ceutorhynchus assimilis]
MANDPSPDTAIQFVSPKTKIHKFTDTILDKKIIFQIVNLENSIMIYINNIDEPICNNLDLAMCTRFSSTPQTTSLIGAKAESSGSNVAGRLAKKLNKTLYLSLNLEDSRFMVPLVEKRLIQEINQFPGKF